jgi:hypothetical protein
MSCAIANRGFGSTGVIVLGRIVNNETFGAASMWWQCTSPAARLGDASNESLFTTLSPSLFIDASISSAVPA